MFVRKLSRMSGRSYMASALFVEMSRKVFVLISLTVFLAMVVAVLILVALMVPYLTSAMEVLYLYAWRSLVGIPSDSDFMVVKCVVIIALNLGCNAVICHAERVINSV